MQLIAVLDLLGEIVLKFSAFSVCFCVRISVILKTQWMEQV